MAIGENIKNLREKLQLTQCQLAEMVGVSRPMIAQIERGTKVPTMPLGKKIAQCLRCSMEDLSK